MSTTSEVIRPSKFDENVSFRQVLAHQFRGGLMTSPRVRNILQQHRDFESRGERIASQLNKVAQELGSQRRLTIAPELFNAHVGTYEHDELVQHLLECRERVIAALNDGFLNNRLQRLLKPL